MIESRRQRARGVSRFLGDKVIEDGLPCRLVRANRARAITWTLEAFCWRYRQGAPPSPSLEDGLRAQLLADKATEVAQDGTISKDRRLN